MYNLNNFYFFIKNSSGLSFIYIYVEETLIYIYLGESVNRFKTPYYKCRKGANEHIRITDIIFDTPVVIVILYIVSGMKLILHLQPCYRPINLHFCYNYIYGMYDF